MNIPMISIISPMHAATVTIIVNAVAETRPETHIFNALSSFLTFQDNYQ